MQLTFSIINRLRRNEQGQDLMEYGLLIALIAVFAMGAVGLVGSTILNIFWSAIAAASV